MLIALLVQAESGLPAHMVAQVAPQQQVHLVVPGLQAKPSLDGGLLVAVPDPLVLARLKSQACSAGRHLVAASLSTIAKQACACKSAVVLKVPLFSSTCG